jgi:1,2-phenylacetyl-CoA epoxidase catalytic subunit
MTNFKDSLEEARRLYNDAVNDYNSYASSLLTDDPGDEAVHKIKILQKRCEIMQDYFNNTKEAADIFYGDE